MDLDRVRTLVRDLYSELGLDGSQPPAKKKPVGVRYEPAPNGGTFQIDEDEDGNEVHRAWIPDRVISKGVKAAGGE